MKWNIITEQETVQAVNIYCKLRHALPINLGWFVVAYGVTNLNGTPVFNGDCGLVHIGGGVGDRGTGDLLININTIENTQTFKQFEQSSWQLPPATVVISAF